MKITRKQLRQLINEAIESKLDSEISSWVSRFTAELKKITVDKESLASILEEIEGSEDSHAWALVKQSYQDKYGDDLAEILTEPRPAWKMGAPLRDASDVKIQNAIDNLEPEIAWGS
jgi:hypothetical protein